MGKWIKLTNDDGGTIALKYIAGHDQFIDGNKPFQPWVNPAPVILGPGTNTGTTDATFPPTTTAISDVPNIYYLQPSDQSFKDYYNALDTAAGGYTLRKPNSSKRLVYLTDPPSSNKPETNAGGGLAASGEFVALFGVVAPRYRFLDAYSVLDLYIARVSQVSKIIRKTSGIPLGTVDPSTGVVVQPRNAISAIDASGFEGFLVVATVLEPGSDRPLSSNSNSSPKIIHKAFSTEEWESWTYKNSISIPVNSVSTPPPNIDIPPGTIPVLNVNSVSEYLDHVYGQLDEIFGPF